MKNYIFLMLAVLFWSGNFVFGRLISSSIEPMELSFYRWFFVLVLLSPYILLRYKNIYSVFKENYLILCTLGALGISGFNTFLYFGLQTTTATNALLINSSTPIFIIVLSSLIFARQISKIQFLGVILSTLGVVFLIIKGNINLFSNIEFTHGDLWVIVSALSWALYCVLLKYKPMKLNPLEFFCSITIIGVLILSVIYTYQGYSITNLNFMSNNEVLFSLMYIVIFPSILSFYFWNSATIAIGASKAGQFTHLMPIFGAIIAYFLLDEVLQFYHLVGMSLIFLGIYLTLFVSKSEKV